MIFCQAGITEAKSLSPLDPSLSSSSLCFICHAGIPAELTLPTDQPPARSAGTSGITASSFGVDAVEEVLVVCLATGAADAADEANVVGEDVAGVSFLVLHASRSRLQTG